MNLERIAIIDLNGSFLRFYFANTYIDVKKYEVIDKKIRYELRKNIFFFKIWL